jgi:hypothetical protein
MALKARSSRLAMAKMSARWSRSASQCPAISSLGKLRQPANQINVFRTLIETQMLVVALAKSTRFKSP